jgi:hypothetical protein
LSVRAAGGASQRPEGETDTLRHRRLHRLVFTLAGIYNLAWGALTAVRPNWPFDLMGIPPMRYPEVFACLGMVIGLYGLLYLQVARVPEAGWWIAAVGLAGKVLGPIGMALAVARGTWPKEAFLWINLPNDLVWLPFFALYLLDAGPTRKR